MATKKVTITLDEEELARIRELVGSGVARSVSAFVQKAVSASLDADAIWAATLAEILDETGGPMTDEERAWADSVLWQRP
jgi:Arc/MetJ-type ribon-helix-helix transcriptional regulator